MMLKRKSTQWARLKLLMFAPLAVVLLQAFARPETVRTQESLITGEGTTISQQSQEWSKDYFDGKVDEYVKKVKGNTKDCGKWFMIDLKLTDENWIWKSGILIPPPLPPATPGQVRFTPPLVSGKYPKTDAGKKEILDRMINGLKKNEEERSKKDVFSPSIVYLHFENVPDAEMQPFLNALGKLNEEITKDREDKNKEFIEKQQQKRGKNTIPPIVSKDAMYSNVPVFVVINERIKLFQKD